MLLWFLRDKTLNRIDSLDIFEDCINIVTHSTSVGDGRAPDCQLPTAKKDSKEEDEHPS